MSAEISSPVGVAGIRYASNGQSNPSEKNIFYERELDECFCSQLKSGLFPDLICLEIDRKHYIA